LGVDSSLGEGLSATRECNRVSVEEGNKVAVVITVDNGRRLPVLGAVEDMVPLRALAGEAPALRLHAAVSA